MTQRLPPSAAIRTTLTWSLVDGILHAVMLGVSESYLGAFAVELGHDTTALALLATVPPLAGALLQLASPWLAVRFGSRKRLVVLGAALQALSHLGFIAIAETESRSLLPLLIAKVGFWTSGMVIAPPWNAWMAALTEGISRARYFLWRTVACHGALLLSFLWAGVYLQAGRVSGVHHHFAVLFSVGLVARSFAALALTFHADPEPVGSGPSALGQRLRAALDQGPWKLALAIGLLQFGAHVAVPFFTPYMLRTLELELDTFAWLTSVTIVAKAVTLPLWGGVVKRWGLGPAMALSVGTIACVPTIWIWATDIPQLVFVQVVGGLGWAGFEYVSLQLLLGRAPKGSAVEFFALSSSLSASLQLVGSLGGSALLAAGASFHLVFFTSSVLRAVPLLLLTPVAASLGRGLALRRLWLRLVTVRPSTGAERRPLLPADETPTPLPGDPSGQFTPLSDDELPTSED